jgi:hypothetical protein
MTTEEIGSRRAHLFERQDTIAQGLARFRDEMREVGRLLSNIGETLEETPEFFFSQECANYDTNGEALKDKPSRDYDDAELKAALDHARLVRVTNRIRELLDELRHVETTLKANRS